MMPEIRVHITHTNYLHHHTVPVKVKQLLKTTATYLKALCYKYEYCIALAKNTIKILNREKSVVSASNENTLAEHNTTHATHVTPW